MHTHPPPDRPPSIERVERQHERQEHRRYLRELRLEKSRDHFKGKDNLPPEKLPPVEGLDFPLVESGPVETSIGVQNEDGLLDKPYARRRYDFHENPQLHGVLMFWVHITLSIRRLTMNTTTLKTWLRQPSTVAGLATLLGTVSAVLLHQITWMQAIPLIVGGFTGVAVNDNTSTIVHQSQANGLAVGAPVPATPKVAP